MNRFLYSMERIPLDLVDDKYSARDNPCDCCLSSFAAMGAMHVVCFDNALGFVRIIMVVTLQFFFLPRV